MRRIRGKRVVSDNDLAPGGNKVEALSPCLAAMPRFLTCDNPMFEPSDAGRGVRNKDNKNEKGSKKDKKKKQKETNKEKYTLQKSLRRRASIWMILELCVVGDICCGHSGGSVKCRGPSTWDICDYVRALF